MAVKIERLLGGTDAVTATNWPFIVLDETGIPVVQATGLKVPHLIREHLTFGWEADRLQRQHPQLTMSEIHSALGYYHQNRDHCDKLVQGEEQRLEELKVELINPALRERLRPATDTA